MSVLAPALLAVALLVAAQDKAEWFGLGINAYQKGDYHEAVEHFTKAIDLDSMNHIFFFNRATCYVKMREYQLAITDLRRTIELDPQSATAYMQLSVALAETQNTQPAIAAVSKAIELDSTLPKAHYLRGRLFLTLQDTARACQDLHQASLRGDPAARSIMNQVCGEVHE